MPRLRRCKSLYSRCKISYSCSPWRTINWPRSIQTFTFLIPHFKAGVFIHFSSYSKLQLLLCLVKRLPISVQEVTASQWCWSAPVHNPLTGSLSLQSIWDFSVHKPCHSGMVLLSPRVSCLPLARQKAGESVPQSSWGAQVHLPLTCAKRPRKVGAAPPLVA